MQVSPARRCRDAGLRFETAPPKTPLNATRTRNAQATADLAQARAAARAAQPDAWGNDGYAERYGHGARHRKIGVFPGWLCAVSACTPEAAYPRL